MLKRDKKAQVTVFVIIAIIIIAGIVGYFILRGGVIERVYVNPTIAPINDFVIDCIEETGYDAAYFIGQQGGYYMPPENSLDIGIPIYIAGTDNYVPSQEEVEIQLEDFINKNLEDCVDYFNEFPEFIIESGEIKTEAKINTEKIKIDVLFPLTIIREDSSYILETFNGIELFTRLGLVYGAAVETTGEISKDFDNICLSCISDIAERSGLEISFYDYPIGDDLSIIFEITDPNSKINEQEYKFVFALRKE